MVKTTAQTVASVERKIADLEVKVSNEAVLLGTRHKMYKRDKQNLESCREILKELKVALRSEQIAAGEYHGE